jgi:hypothetical protein
VGPENNFGLIGPLAFIFHGTKERPAHAKNGPRKYNANYPNKLPENGGDDNRLRTDEEYENSRKIPHSEEKQLIGDERLQDLWRQFDPTDSIFLNDDNYDSNPEEKILQRVHHQNIRNRNFYIDYV